MLINEKIDYNQETLNMGSIYLYMLKRCKSMKKVSIYNVLGDFSFAQTMSCKQILRFDLCCYGFMFKGAFHWAL
jgi:hypothetical protein